MSVAIKRAAEIISIRCGDDNIRFKDIVPNSSADVISVGASAAAAMVGNMPSTMTSTSRILTSLFFINTSCFLEPPSKAALFHKARSAQFDKKPVQKPTARAIRYRKSPCSVWASTKPANVSDLSAYCSITVTDSRGFSPHSASGALPERCCYSLSASL